MELYGLKTCDTCRRALRELAGAGISVAFRDVRRDGMTPELRRALVSRFGEAAINRRSATWRGLDEAARAEPPEDLLAAHPALMKRPLIVRGDGTLLLGWDAETRSALGL